MTMRSTALFLILGASLSLLHHAVGFNVVPIGTVSNNRPQKSFLHLRPPKLADAPRRNDDEVLSDGAIAAAAAAAAAAAQSSTGIEADEEPSNPYVNFAQSYPFANNLMIATAKTAAADLLAQVVIGQVPIDSIDWQRSLLFCLFGAVYLGGFQYLYQVQIFKRLFDIDAFTSQPWADKLRDESGLKALAAQTALDLTVLTLVYLPTFYIFKVGVFSGSMDPSVWVGTGLDNYAANFAKDEFDLVRVWMPADLVCFSVPLYLRLPVRHVVSFVWTAYLSFARGGH